MLTYGRGKGKFRQFGPRASARTRVRVHTYVYVHAFRWTVVLEMIYDASTNPIAPSPSRLLRSAFADSAMYGRTTRRLPG